MSLRHLLRAVRTLLALPDRQREELRDVDKALRAVERTTQAHARKHDAESKALRSEITALGSEVHDRLLQYHLQLGRLSALVEGNGHHRLGSRVALSVGGEPPAAPSASTQRSEVAPEWLQLAACPACQTVDRTVVCEWNKLALLDTAPDDRSRRYDRSEERRVGKECRSARSSQPQKKNETKEPA